MFTVERFEDRFIEEAAEMVAGRVAALRCGVEEVPTCHSDPAPYVPKIRELMAARPGFVALERGRFAGFLGSMRIDDFRGRPAAYSPEWAHGVPRADQRRIVCELYRHAAAEWLAEGCTAHVLTTLAHDIELIGTLHWQSFGNIVIDAVRGCSRLPGVHAKVEIREGGEADVPELVRLDHLLSDHLRGSTTFLDFPSRGAEHWEQVMGDAHCFPMAFVEGRAVAYLKFTPTGFGICNTVRDAKTISISGAFCEKERRSGGIAKALLDFGLAWAREHGYERCSVDWESNNIEATAFWTRYFKPVCVSLIRVVR